jgi:ammonia channel protein AmtB
MSKFRQERFFFMKYVDGCSTEGSDDSQESLRIYAPSAAWRAQCLSSKTCSIIFGGMAWMTVESLDKGKPSVLAPVFGANAGLVAIAPASGFVDQTGAFCIGAITGVSCYFGIQFKKVIGADDALDAFGVHGIGGRGLLRASLFHIFLLLMNVQTFQTQIREKCT